MRFYIRQINSLRPRGLVAPAGRATAYAVAASLIALPAMATIGSVDAAARLMTYFYSVDEIANHCRVTAPSAAPDLSRTYEQWREVNVGKAQQIQRRLQQVLAADLNVPPASKAANDELQANLRETRNTTARLLRRNLEALTGSQRREQCRQLEQNLSTNASLLDRHLAADWRVLFVARPASTEDAIGTWSTAEDCGGERWTLRADGREALSEIESSQPGKAPYAYRGQWSVVDGLYRSVGVERGGASIRLVGNLLATVDGRELQLTVTRQGVQAVGETETTLSDPDDVYTVAYQRCAADAVYPHPPWPSDPAQSPVLQADPVESTDSSNDSTTVENPYDNTSLAPTDEHRADDSDQSADREPRLPRRGPRR